MSTDKAFDDPLLGPVLKQHPELFDEKISADASHNVMLVFLFYEW